MYFLNSICLITLFKTILYIFHGLALFLLLYEVTSYSLQSYTTLHFDWPTIYLYHILFIYLYIYLHNIAQ